MTPVTCNEIRWLLKDGQLSGSCSFKLRVSGERVTLHFPSYRLVDSDKHCSD